MDRVPAWMDENIASMNNVLRPQKEFVVLLLDYAVGSKGGTPGEFRAILDPNPDMKLVYEKGSAFDIEYREVNEKLRRAEGKFRENEALARQEQERNRQEQERTKARTFELPILSNKPLLSSKKAAIRLYCLGGKLRNGAANGGQGGTALVRGGEYCCDTP